MDKVMSARIDEAIAGEIDALARDMGVSKKYVIEQAVTAYAVQVRKAGDTDAFARACGVWDRSGLPSETAAESRAAFNRSFSRRHA